MTQINPFESARDEIRKFPGVVLGDVEACLMVAAMLENVPFGHDDIRTGDIPRLWEVIIRDLWRHPPEYRDAATELRSIGGRFSLQHPQAIERARAAFRAAARASRP